MMMASMFLWRRPSCLQSPTRAYSCRFRPPVLFASKKPVKKSLDFFNTLVQVLVSQDRT